MLAPVQSIEATGRRVCAWCSKDMGAVAMLPAGRTTHGICPSCKESVLEQATVKPEVKSAPVFWVVRRHPAGGWTHAGLMDPAQGTARIYSGWYPSFGAASDALDARIGGAA